MELESREINFKTQGHTDVIDITPDLVSCLREIGISQGNVTVFAIGSTTGLTTIEYEPGLVKHDIRELYEKLSSYNHQYKHNLTWGDNNGASHLRSMLTGTSIVVPILDNKLVLGTWQQVVFIDFDTRPRERKVIAQFIGK